LQESAAFLMRSEAEVRVGFVEWPEGLEPYGPAWAEIEGRIANAQVDLLITNELPFGPWIAERKQFDRAIAQASIEAHAAGLDALESLRIPAVLTSRPAWGAERLLNQAVVLEDGRARVIHTKQYFPEEPGWYEASWYEPGPERFQSAEVAGLRTGAMLCTDAMFNEHARHYGRDGVTLIALPRAASTKTDNWLTAGKMAALVSGSYVISSNRSGQTSDGTVFGGAGFAFGPGGTLLATTDATNPMGVIEVDTELAVRQRGEYPCYVAEGGI
jgi:N-carbamoylputrescine amidase